MLVVFNECQDVLHNKKFDEIISQLFPIIGVLNQRLTNIEVGFILQPFLIIIELQGNSNGFELHRSAWQNTFQVISIIQW